MLEARAATLQQEIDRDSQGERDLKLTIASLQTQLVAVPGCSQVRNLIVSWNPYSSSSRVVKTSS